MLTLYDTYMYMYVFTLNIHVYHIFATIILTIAVK